MGTNVQVETETSKAPQTMNGALMLIEALKREKVEVIFGYPGGAVLPIYDKIYDSGLFHVLPRHEQGAIHAAEGYARVSGKPGVVIATSGPGATNLVTGIADAMMIHFLLLSSQDRWQPQLLDRMLSRKQMCSASQCQSQSTATK